MKTINISQSQRYTNHSTNYVRHSKLAQLARQTIGTQIFRLAKKVIFKIISSARYNSCRNNDIQTILILNIISGSFQTGTATEEKH